MRSGLLRCLHASACALLLLPTAHTLALTVVVERLPDGAVRVDYELEVEMTELVLDVGGPSAQFWTVLGDTLVLRNGRIASTTGSPFAAASVRIEPAPLRGYARAAVVALGPRSSVIDVARILPAAAGSVAVELRNAFDADARACAEEYTRHDAAQLRRGASWYAVVATTHDACRAVIHDGSVQVLAEEVPAPLLLTAAQQMRTSYLRLAAKLRVPLDPPPTLILSYAPGSSGGNSMVGKGSDSVVLARLEGASWAAPTALQTSGLAFSLTTALVRSWLDVLPQEGLLGGTGAAQYLAALDRHGAGEEIFDQPAGRILLGEIDDCGRQVGVVGVLRTAEPTPGIVRACGPLIQFVYDAVARSESAGRRTIFDVWADVLAQADDDPPNAESFLATNERAHAAVAGLVYGAAVDFAGIAELLRSSGIDAAVGDPRDTGGAVATLLRALVRDDCNGRFGGTQIKGDRIAFDMREPCRTLPQKFELIAIEGVGVATSARALYEAVATACSGRGRVRLTGDVAIQQFEIGCPATVPELPQQLYVRDAYFLK